MKKNIYDLYWLMCYFSLLSHTIHAKEGPNFIDLVYFILYRLANQPDLACIIDLQIIVFSNNIYYCYTFTVTGIKK